MMRVYKYPIPVATTFTLLIHKGARLLHVERQHDQACMWALVDPDAKPVERYFRVYGTGHPIDDASGLTYIGTFQINGGEFVFHLFEVSP